MAAFPRSRPFIYGTKRSFRWSDPPGPSCLFWARVCEAACRLDREPLNARAALAELLLNSFEASIEVINAADQGFALGGESSDAVLLVGSAAPDPQNNSSITETITLCVISGPKLAVDRRVSNFD